jgi:uncharacterized membrane protein
MFNKPSFAMAVLLAAHAARKQYPTTILPPFVARLMK